MTREEAIQILKAERYCQEYNADVKRIRKAYDMAIEALQQDPPLVDPKKPVTKREVETLKKMAEAYGQNISDICRTYKVNRLEDMTHDMYGKALMVFKGLEKK